MSEHHPDTREIPLVVTMRWDNGPASVAIDPDWKSRMTAPELLQQVVTVARDHLPAESSHGWRDQIDLTKVPLSQLREFTALIREARAEAADAPHPEGQQVSGRHLQSRWYGRSLISVTGDEQWLVNASRQALSDEFLTVLTAPPESPDPGISKARDRFVAFMKEQ